MGALLKAFVLGLFGGLFQWLDRRRAEQDRIAKERDEAVLDSQAERKQTEDAIKEAGHAAHAAAGTDFGGLQ